MIDFSPFEQYIILDKKSFILFCKTLYGCDVKTCRSLFEELDEYHQAYLNHALSEAISILEVNNLSAKDNER